MSAIKATGVTEPYAVALQVADRLPRLTEEEERWHGALIGNTAYGLLLRAIDALEFDFDLLSRLQKASEEGVDVMVIGQDTGLPYAVPWSMPALHTLETMAAGALQEPVNRAAKNSAEYLRSWMRTNSYVVQESVAKYLAVLSALDSCIDSHVRREIESIYVSSLELFSRLVPNFRKLHDVVGSPTEIQGNEFFVRKHVAYFLGKASLSGTELQTLAALEPPDLQSAFANADFLSPTCPNDRLELLLADPSWLREMAAQLADVAGLSAEEQDSRLEVLYSDFLLHCEEILATNGADTDCNWDEIFHNALCLSHTFPNAFGAVSAHLGSKTFSVEFSPSGRCLKAGRRFGSVSGFFDTSQQVYVEWRSASVEPRRVEADELLRTLECSIRTNTLVVASATARGVTADFFPLISRCEHEGLFEPHPNFPQGLEVELADKAELHSLLGHLPPDEASICFPGTQFIDSLALRGELVRRFRPTPVLFLEPMARLWKVDSADWFQFVTGTPGAVAAGYWHAEAQRRMGVLTVHSSGDDAAYGVFSCVPFYFRELATRRNDLGQLKTDLREMTPDLVSDCTSQRLIIAAYMLLCCAYLFDCLPGSLQMLEDVDPWT